MAIQRRGRPCNWTYDVEALEILKALCPRGKSYGQFVSRLIVEEERRQIEARKWRAKLAGVVEELAAP